MCFNLNPEAVIQRQPASHMPNYTPHKSPPKHMRTYTLTCKLQGAQPSPCCHGFVFLKVLQELGMGSCAHISLLYPGTLRDFLWGGKQNNTPTCFMAPPHSFQKWFLNKRYVQTNKCYA